MLSRTQFTNSDRLYIMYQGIDVNNKKALTERERIILNNPRLGLQQAHVTLLDIVFNRDHVNFDDIVHDPMLSNVIRTAYNTHLRGI